MSTLPTLGRFLLYNLVLLWAPAWLAAWWLWPPAPRSGWQIPADERCLGFLSDSWHVVTEELAGEGKERTATGTVYVRNVNTGAAYASYTSPKEAYRSLEGDLLIETTHRNEKPVQYPPGNSFGQVNLCDVRVCAAWTGAALFEEHRVHHFHMPVCREHGIMSHVRHVDPPGYRK